MHDTIQTARPPLSIPRWPSRPPIARFHVSFEWSSPRNALAQRKKRYRTLTILQNNGNTKACLSYLACSLSRARVRARANKITAFSPFASGEVSDIFRPER
jgi:hypothetical protein